MRTEALIIGAGPAGLSAAIELGQRGIETLVVDEYPVPGGRLLGQMYQSQSGWWIGRRVAEDLLERLGRFPNVHLMLETSVSGLAHAGGGWTATFSQRAGTVDAQAVLIATGATEVPIPLPNWTLPGVMTVGAAQTMANVHGVRPGERGIIIGFGALAFAVADELTRAGVDLAGIVLPPLQGPSQWLGTVQDQWRRLRDVVHLGPRWARAATPLVASDFWLERVMAGAPQKGIPALGTVLRPNVAAIAMAGEEAVSGVWLQRVDRRGTLVGEPWHEAVDFACLSGGLRPVPDLAAATGAAMKSSRSGLHDVPIFGPVGETTAPGIFAAGNVLGIEGAPVAMAQGQLASIGVLRHLSGNPTDWAAEQAAFSRALEVARERAPLVFDRAWSQIHEEIRQAWTNRPKEG